MVNWHCWTQVQWSSIPLGPSGEMCFHESSGKWTFGTSRWEFNQLPKQNSCPGIVASLDTMEIFASYLVGCNWHIINNHYVAFHVRNWAISSFILARIFIDQSSSDAWNVPYARAKYEETHAACNSQKPVFVKAPVASCLDFRSNLPLARFIYFPALHYH